MKSVPRHDNERSTDADGLGYEPANPAFWAAPHPATVQEGLDDLISFVHSEIGISVEYFFNDTASDIGGIYTNMTDAALGGAESSLTTAGLGAGDDQALVNFATLSGFPGINNLRSGIYDAHIHVEKTAGTKPVRVYAQIYSRTDPGGVETLVTTTEVSDLITDKVELTLHAVVASEIMIDVSDRLVVKWFANIGTTGSDVTIVLYQEGDTSSHMTLPTTTEILSNIFLRQDGTEALNGDMAVDSGKTIDGRDISVDGDKLDGIESGATADQLLNEIGNPDGDTVINMLDKLLAFAYVAPTAGGGLGAFQIKAFGALTGILCAIEQSGSTAGASTVLDLKATDPDAKPLVIAGAHANSIEADKTFKTTLVTGTKPLDVASTTLCDNLNADLLDGSHASAFAASSHVHDGDTLELDGINSDGGGFNFFTFGPVSFNAFVDGILRLDVDNIRIDGNTLSSTDTNGDINISPDGTGVAKLGNIGDTSIGDGTLRFFGPQEDLKVDLGDVDHRFNETHTKYLVLAILTDATRGAAGTKGRVIFNDDDGQLNIDDGTDWTLPDGTTT